MSYDENRISDQIDGAENDKQNIYDLSNSFSKTELELHINKLEYQLSEIKEHGLGDSDAALTDAALAEWTIKRDLKIFKWDLNKR